MGLDYTNGCVNFRDVGEFVNLILDEKRLPEGLILRGGSIDFIKDLEEIKNPITIINLRNRADFDVFNSENLHFPMSNKVEKYDTTSKDVRRWLNQIIKVFENGDLEYPVLIHCLSGKDRTGIVVASLLLILEVDKETIIEEYLLSEGEVSESLIQISLVGIGNVEEYFDRVDLEIVRKNILSN